LNNGQTHWLARWWPAIVWAIAISGFSTGAFTSEHTSRIIIPVLHWLFPGASPDRLALMHHYVRKCGHLTEYFILSLLLLRGIRGGRREVKFAWIFATIILVAAYASLDEFHQSFVPGRTALVSDVLIDTAGGTAAQVIVALALLWGHVRRQRRQDRERQAETAV
jgi:VanZ family protein